VPPRLDVCWVIDVSGSFFDDLPNLTANAAAIFNDTIAAAAPGTVRFGLASFSDFPFSPWGSDISGDYAYRLEQTLTGDVTTWVNAVSALALRNGVDTPESQYEAIVQAINGGGLDVGDAGPSLGDIAAGQDCDFDDPDAFKVIVMLTDAPFHTTGDSDCTAAAPPCPFPYPGANEADALLAMGSDFTFIGLEGVTPGDNGELDALAAATGGVVEPVASDSADIATAIANAIGDLTFDITGNPVACEPLDITFDPPVHEDVLGGDTVVFEEWIEVPADVTGDQLTDGEVHCTVEFHQDGIAFVRQAVWITVKRTVDIDIKPNSDPNSINLNQKGNTAVAILGSAIFDVGDVDLTTLSFGPLMATPVHAALGHFEDVNADGFTDLVSHYKTSEMGILPGDTEGCVNGFTNDGINFMGCDAVRPLHD
jgi:hypothetical protein